MVLRNVVRGYVTYLLYLQLIGLRIAVSISNQRETKEVICFDEILKEKNTTLIQNNSLVVFIYKDMR